MDQDDGEQVVVEVQVEHDLEHGNRDHLLRNRHEQDDREEEVVAHGEPKASEAIARQGCNKNRNESRRNGDQERIGVGPRQGQDRICEGRDKVIQAWVKPVEVPPSVRDLGNRTDGRTEHPEEGDKPGQGDRPCDQMHRDCPQSKFSKGPLHHFAIRRRINDVEMRVNKVRRLATTAALPALES